MPRGRTAARRSRPGPGFHGKDKGMGPWDVSWMPDAAAAVFIAAAVLVSAVYGVAASIRAFREGYKDGE